MRRLLLAAPWLVVGVGGAQAETVLTWEMGGAVPVYDVRKPSTINPKNRSLLSPDAPVYFQTAFTGGYRFHFGRSFFITPLGYYRLTAGNLVYRDINLGVNLTPDNPLSDLNRYDDAEYLGNQLGGGAELGFIIDRFTISGGLLAGVNYVLTRATSRYFNDRSVINQGKWSGNMGWVLVPRFAVDYSIVRNINLGVVADYSFDPAQAARGIVNWSLRATFQF